MTVKIILTVLNVDMLNNLPENLEELYCIGIKLTFLPAGLPKNLKKLNVSNNELTYLPSLPPFLQELNCRENDLTYLPHLPPTLKILDCSKNRLTYLPPLPFVLEELVCRENELICFPILPPNVHYYDFRYNAFIQRTTTTALISPAYSSKLESSSQIPQLDDIPPPPPRDRHLQYLMRHIDSMPPLMEQKNFDISGCNIQPLLPQPPAEPPAEPAEPAPKIDIIVEIKTLQDLIDLAEKYELGPQYNINIAVLKKIVDELREIRDMIGMKELKQSIVDQIIYFIQDMHLSSREAPIHDYKHTILTGPPGTGKTEIAKIIGRMFFKMGVLENASGGGNNRFRKATRTDLIGGYLGQTAIKTTDVIRSCLGGVLFIDEAYSLTVNTDSKQDTYAKECLDTLCEALSDHRNDLMVIIAGYENEIAEMLKSNRGLESRFIWRHNINKYSAVEMRDILLKKIREQGWTVSSSDAIQARWFETREFKHFGRDMEKLWTFMKIRHSRRVYGTTAAKREITEADLNAGYALFLENQGKPNEPNVSLSMLYV